MPNVSLSGGFAFASDPAVSGSRNRASDVLLFLTVAIWSLPLGATDPFFYSSPNSLESQPGAHRVTDPYLPGSLVCVPVADPLVSELCAASGTLDFGDWTSVLPFDGSPGLEFRGSGADEFDISFSKPVYSFGFDVYELSAQLELTFFAGGAQVSQRTAGLNAFFWGLWSPVAFDEVQVRVVDPSDEVFFGAIYAGQRPPGPIQKFGVGGHSQSRSVALDQGIAAVGVAGVCGLFPQTTESVELYDLDAMGWRHHATIDDPNPSSGDRFGNSVALQGDLVLVGAPCFDSAVQGGGDGRVFLYRLDGLGGASLVTELSPPVPFAGHGWSVSIDVDLAVVGSYRDEVNLYRRDEGGPDNWGHVARLVGSDVMPGDSFGLSVEIEGSRLAVGAPESQRTGRERGAVYLFERNGSDPSQWDEVAILDPTSTASGLMFGQRLALDSDRLAVASPLSAFGEAYLFERDLGGPGAWGLRKKLVVPGGSGSDFASSIALEGDVVFLGQPFSPILAFGRNVGGADAWGLQFYLRAPDGHAGSSSLAIDGDWLLSRAGHYLFPWRHLFGDGFEAGSSVAWDKLKP